MRMTRSWLAAVLIAVLGSTVTAWAQTPAPAPEAKKEEEKPKTFWDENQLFAYIENSFTANLSGSGRGGVNELRQYDYHEGYTFNIAEFSIKKDPSERYPFGYGLTVTAGIDSQKNHSYGIFRDEDDAFPFRNTEKFDLQQAYVSELVPVGSGLTLKAGKFVTLLGYEVIESPNNPNFSRGYLFSFAIPFTHTGGLASYTFTDWFNVTAGVVLGWDDSKNVNDSLSYTGQFAFTPLKDFSANLTWIVGPEQVDPRRVNENVTRDSRRYVNAHQRYVLDWTFNYTGFKNWTLGLNIDYGHEQKEAFIQSLGTRRDTDATWWGWAGYVVYDWTENLRTALRQEFFRDAAGARTGFGNALDLWSTTATIQYKIWKGLVGRLEYRHDQADEKVFRVRYSRPDITSQGLLPRGKSMDTISASLYYSFF
jgi:hypothetical protein